jgi:hypothetical protein
MSISIAASNEHPVDELAHVQEKIAILKLREQELRQLILQGSCGLSGDHYQASVTMSLGRKIDLGLLRDVFCDEELALLSKPAQAVYVRTSRKHEVATRVKESSSFAGPLAPSEVLPFR